MSELAIVVLVLTNGDIHFRVAISRWNVLDKVCHFGIKRFFHEFTINRVTQAEIVSLNIQTNVDRIDNGGAIVGARRGVASIGGGSSKHGESKEGQVRILHDEILFVKGVYVLLL